MDNSSGPDDEITIDPLSTPNIPIPRAARAIVSRISREWPAGSWRRPTRRSWLLAAIAAVVVIGALKLAGVVWTSAPPRWVPALGTGVTVTEPGQVAPGHGSPGRHSPARWPRCPQRTPQRCVNTRMHTRVQSPSARHRSVEPHRIKPGTSRPSRLTTWRSTERVLWSDSLARSARQAISPCA